MNSKLSKNEVLSLLFIWSDWMRGPEPAKNKPQEFKRADEIFPKGISGFFGIILHLYLWFLSKVGHNLKITPLTMWASKNRVKFDSLWWEPISCGLNNSYTDLGLSYLESGDINNSIECLDKSWRVYPCPHNTSFGIKLSLYLKLKEIPEAHNATKEYLDMWHKFKST
jgi:hypothetical protein